MSSFDPFQARLDFLQLVRKLNASQPSIHKVVAFALRYASRCGEDLWECLVEESGKVSWEGMGLIGKGQGQGHTACRAW